jgi:hypothetical protein
MTSRCSLDVVPPRLPAAGRNVAGQPSFDMQKAASPRGGFIRCPVSRHGGLQEKAPTCRFFPGAPEVGAYRRRSPTPGRSFPFFAETGETRNSPANTASAGSNTQTTELGRRIYHDRPVVSAAGDPIIQGHITPTDVRVAKWIEPTLSSTRSAVNMPAPSTTPDLPDSENPDPKAGVGPRLA